MADGDRLDWNDEDLIRICHSASDVVLYENDDGDFVLRASAHPLERDDSTIVIPVDAAPRLVAGLAKLLRERAHESVTVGESGLSVVRVPKD